MENRGGELPQVFLQCFMESIFHVLNPALQRMPQQPLEQIGTAIPSIKKTQIPQQPQVRLKEIITQSPSRIRTIQQYPQPRQQQPQKKETTVPTLAQGLPSTLKISALLKDPIITEIECRGADQPLMIKRGNALQSTKISLSEQEIQAILTECSQKTNIPIIEGTFKAAMDTIIITAVVSEILGARFIIKKRNPFQQLVS